MPQNMNKRTRKRCRRSFADSCHPWRWNRCGNQGGPAQCFSCCRLRQGLRQQNDPLGRGSQYPESYVLSSEGPLRNVRSRAHAAARHVTRRSSLRHDPVVAVELRGVERNDRAECCLVPARRPNGVRKMVLRRVASQRRRRRLKPRLIQPAPAMMRSMPRNRPRM